MDFHDQHQEPVDEPEDEPEAEVQEPPIFSHWAPLAGVVGGSALGYGAVCVGFAAIGLSPVGPIAGGWFAANMGAGLTAGGVMATLQSAAMTASAYWSGAAVGGIVAYAANVGKE